MDISEDVFRALASRTRLDLLDLLRDKQLQCTDPNSCDLSERCCNVSELAEKLNLTQPTISHHLKELRRSGLITVEKEGRRKHCSIEDKTFEQLCEFIQSFYKYGVDDSCN